MVSRDPDAGLAGEPRSLWIDRSDVSLFDPLEGRLSVDVAVVGGGIAGLTAATLLKEAGKTVALVEADRVGEGATGYSTAKVTASHGLIYDQLASSVGERRARGYAEANAAAVDRVETLAEDHDTDCSFERLDSYTYTESPDERSKIRAEVEAASRFGLPASYTEDVPLPFDVEAAIRVRDQAQFDPWKYTRGLAADLPGDGCHVFERTKATGLETGRRPIVTTTTLPADGNGAANDDPDGGVDGAVRAQDVVVATHFPFFDPAAYFARMYPERSYLLAARVEAPPEAMCYQDIGTYEYRSTRPYPTDDGPGMLIGGEGHKTGQGGSVVDRYRALERYARERFDAESIEFRWSNQDYTTVDELPYIGRIAPHIDNVYVATGFNGWGNSNGTAAGMVLRDLIVDRESRWEHTFDPSRATVRASLGTFAEENVNVGRRFASDWASGLRSGSPDALAAGEADVMRIDGEPTAVHCDADGEVHAVSAVCTHLKCLVQWNDGEGTWDCPCHGSRFGIDGKVIDGPADVDLPERDLE